MHKLKNLDTKILGKNVINYEVIDSTQKEIWRRIEKDNIENGTLISADLQTSGVGTHGRTWYTNKKNNIAFSFVIFPNISISKLTGLTMKIAETIVEVFKDIYNIDLQIKPPNDIVINNKKIGGILTETKIYKEVVKALVIGIGINTNQKEFEGKIKDIASSVSKEFNIKEEIDNDKIIIKFCNIFERKLEEIGAVI